MEDQPQPLTQEKIEEYRKAFADHLPGKLNLAIQWRTPRTGHIVPAGAITTTTAETHSVEAGSGRLLLFTTGDQEETDVMVLCLTPFPQARVDYMSITVLPPASTPMERVRVERVPAIPHPRIAQPQPPATQVQDTIQDNEPFFENEGILGVGRQSVEGQNGSGVAKRPREDALAEDVGDALRGDARKRAICVGLKVPQEIVPKDRFLYPPTWIGGSTGATNWRACFAEYVQEQQVDFTLPAKRLEASML
jgi:hypothetical protein